MEYWLLVVGTLLVAVYFLSTAIYQVNFHPLAPYNGSYVAAISSSWYEWYWNYLLNGRMLFEIERLHQLHGPVVRIGPNDLSVNDPEVFMDMTRVSSGFTKDPNLYRWISLPGTSIGETNPENHRIRRKVLTPALSGSRVNELAPFISTKVKQLLDRFDILSRDSLLVDFDSACKALTMDIISKVVLGQDINCVEQPCFKNDFTDQFRQALSAGWFPTAFPSISAMALNLSSTFLSRIIPNPMMDFRRSRIKKSGRGR
ncbi:hypothetical protein NW762_006366 [Fusarium torreyae]|uniref:Cytochrome P450 n=1 Tax=Fusarium torreyae TaxID=1237075 RepID=A0A9W8S0B7_9HYPO|nr:hypothetical protein NW762_006366 [Fusarium torreyae]